MNKDQTIKATLTLFFDSESSDKVNLNNLKLKFEKPQSETSFFNLLFDKNSSTKTAAFKASNNLITEANIPVAISSNNDVYLVTEIYYKYENSKYIGGFSGCENLNNVTIPKTIKIINNSAFQGCTGLTQNTISASVTEIGVSAFNDCSNSTLTSITYLGTKAQWYSITLCSYWNSDNITKVVCSDGGNIFTTILN